MNKEEETMKNEGYVSQYGIDILGTVDYEEMANVIEEHFGVQVLGCLPTDCGWTYEEYMNL